MFAKLQHRELQQLHILRHITTNPNENRSFYTPETKSKWDSCQRSFPARWVHVLGSHGLHLSLTFTIAEPVWPFMAAGLIVAYAINAGANAMMKCTIPPSQTELAHQIALPSAVPLANFDHLQPMSTRMILETHIEA
jgi:ATP synthase j chain